MTLLYPADQVRIGACLRCNAVFLVTPTTENHLICGEPAAFTMPFPVSGGAEPSEVAPPDFPEAPPETPSVFPVSCPSCQAALTLSISETEILLTAEIALDPAAEAADSPPWDEPSAPPPAPERDGSAGQEPATVGAETDIPAEPSPPDPDREGYVPRDMYPTQPAPAATDDPETVP